jgi:Tfp pilus assembly protein PilV
MNPNPPLHHRSPRGISLMEVLISIGILAIGLTAVLSLIPAGRSYMQKAAIDDRAATLIPNAYALVEDRRMFRVNALSWQAFHGVNGNDGESAPVVRSAAGSGWSAKGKTQDSHWTIQSPDSETIEERWPRTTPPDLQGTEPGSTSVTVTTTPATSTFSGTTALNGAWKILLREAVLPAPDLEIVTSGNNVGEPTNQPYVDYTFKAEVEVSGSMRPTGVTPSTYRQYGQLRRTDLRTGRARVTYELGSDPRENETEQQSTPVAVRRIREATFPGRNSIAYASTASMTGHLWRMQVGTQEGRYRRRGSFPNTFPSPGTWDSPSYDHVDMITNAGTWVDGSGNPQPGPNSSPEDVDWFQFPVEDDIVVELAWTDPAGVLAPNGAGACCSLYLGSGANEILPFSVGSGRAWYWIPTGGTAYTRLALRPVDPADDTQIPNLQNTFGPEGQPEASRTNPSYTLSVTVSRPERAIAFDPLMATRLDKIIAAGGTALRSRRERFADFQQQIGGQQRAFVIPRLNLQDLALLPVDRAVAAAERWFRDEDAIAIDPPANDDDPPTPRFDNSGSTPLRRQAAGRMSWMMLIQPQDPGPVALNWVAGRMFDVSFVIFQDRKLPPLDASASFDGEYAFSGSWSESSGMLSVTVPFDLDRDGERDLVADDIRSIFRSGSWLLVAPARASTSPAFSNQQKLGWIRIRTAELVNEADRTVVRILLESEPNADVLMRSTLPANTLDFPVAVLAYEGVVAVVTKTLQLEPSP